jgi:PilX N-terminal
MNINKQIYSERGHHSQGGFVLVLALVMLTVLTLIGVSSMNRANMELKAAANSWQHQIAFNAANSLNDYVLSGPGSDVIDYLAVVPSGISAFTVAGASNISAAVTKTGCSVSIGSSLEAGKSFSNNYFTVVGQASNSTNTSTSFQTQGVRYPAAGCDKSAVTP